MKLGNMILLYLIMTLVLLMFQNIGTLEPSSGDLDWFNKSYGENLTEAQIGLETYTSKVWWDSLLDPTFYNQGIVKMIIAIALIMLGSFALAALVSKSYPTDTFIFAPWFIVTLGFGLFPTFLAANFVMTELSSFMCVPGPGGIIQFCMMPTLIGIIVAAAIFLPFIFACIRHWRTGVE